MTEKPETRPLSEDEFEFVWGAERIGDVIGQNPNVTYRLLSEGRLPARKIGKLWVSERNTLRRHIMPAA